MFSLPLILLQNFSKISYFKLPYETIPRFSEAFGMPDLSSALSPC